MKNKIINKLILGASVFAFTMVSCVKDLDRTPFVEVTSATVYTVPANYKLILAKLYAVLAVSGQQGPSGKPDIKGIDEGFSNYLRQYWKAQELTTDEAIIGWNDGSLPDYHYMTWTSSNEFVGAMYNRIYYQISLCNEYIRESTDSKLSSRGISGTVLTDIKAYRAEARFLRALSYYHALDMFGNVPFVTENDAVGSIFPTQISRADLFKYVESELLAIDADLVGARQNEYGRADKAAAWTLLAKLYLNAEVYIGQPKYTEAIANCSKVIAAGYSLEADYQKLFLTDNASSKEIIFPITFDGLYTKSYGGMTFLVHAPVGGSMNPASFGINGGWSGIRTTKTFTSNFADITGKTDRRALFYTDGQELDITDVFAFTNGYAIGKFKNVSSTGVKGSDPAGDFPDTDFPMFRLADVYLMYAEAVVRGGTGGNAQTALDYVNLVRTRAYKGTTGNITASAFNLEFLLKERARELFWEGHRRTDLIRFGKYTDGSLLWAWKGKVKDGKAVANTFNLFPIPSSDIVANPNLKQNPGY
jgi:starch-binding outer membrane protein, SusD/RagB family